MNEIDPAKYPTLAKYKLRSRCSLDSLFAFQCEELQEKLDRNGIIHFTASEFFNSCRNPNNIVESTVYDSVLSSAYLTLSKLDKIRYAFGRAIHINSGYRNPITNRLVKGVPNSLHMRGLAVDIRPATPYLIRDLWRICKQFGYFSEMILHENYIHLGIK